MITSRSASLPHPAWRWTAVLCGVTVWLLGLFAANPQLHSALHGEAGHADHVCAVTLFGQGTENPLPATTVVVFPPTVSIERLVPAAPARVESPEDWLQPGRGPPAC